MQTTTETDSQHKSLRSDDQNASNEETADVTQPQTTSAETGKSTRFTFKGLSSQTLIAHGVLVIVNFIWTSFYLIANRYILPHVHPMVFTWYRLATATLCIAAFAVFVEYRQRRQNKSNQTVADERDVKEVEDAVARERLQLHESTATQLQVHRFTERVWWSLRFTHLTTLPVMVSMGRYWSRLQFATRNVITIPDPKYALLCFVSGLFGYVANMVLFIYGVSETSGTNASIFQPATSIFATLLSFLLRKELVSIWKVIGVLVSVAGAVIVLVLGKGDFHFDTENVFANMFFIGNTAAWAAYIVLGKIIAEKVPVATATFYAMATGFICVSIINVSGSHFSTIQFELVPLSCWIAATYSAVVCSAVVFMMVVYATKHTSPVVSSVYMCALPLMTAVGNYLIFDEQITWPAAVGGVLIVAGVALLLFTKYREQQKLQLQLQQQQQQQLEQTSIEMEETMGTELDSPMDTESIAANSRTNLTLQEDDD